MRIHSTMFKKCTVEPRRKLAGLLDHCHFTKVKATIHNNIMRVTLRKPFASPQAYRKEMSMALSSTLYKRQPQTRETDRQGRREMKTSLVKTVTHTVLLVLCA